MTLRYVLGKSFSALIVLTVALLCGSLTRAQNATSSAAAAPVPTTTDMNGKSVPDLTGFWELHYDSANVPFASLTPQAMKDDKEARRQKDMNVLRWCNKTGIPFSMDGPAPIDIQQGRFETSIASQAVSPGRHIFTNGQKHPDLEAFDRVVNGHSIGHWERDTFVVDTIGFSTQGITTIPGGGYRTEESHLIEHYRLLDGGTKLLVTSTWEDPKVFKTPHTYQFEYFRAAPGYTAREYFCDPTDEQRVNLLTETPKE
jgi:hypothetical protein